MMRENRLEEILLVEDIGNPLELSINTLKDNGCSHMCITQKSNDVIGSEIQRNGTRKNANIFDMSYMLIYAKPNETRPSKVLTISPELKVIPLLLLVGPRKDINVITDRMHDQYNCFKKTVYLQKFINKMKKMPMYWGTIDIKNENTFFKG